MSDTHNKLVLLVEDTPEMAAYMQLALKTLPIQVAHVDRGQKAVDFLEQQRPDLILLDIAMPDMSGWQVLDVIKERCLDDGIHVIVTTAFTDPANRLVGKFQNIAQYLTKPFEVAELRQAVNQVLNLDGS